MRPLIGRIILPDWSMPTAHYQRAQAAEGAVDIQTRCCVDPSLELISYTTPSAMHSQTVARDEHVARTSHASGVGCSIPRVICGGREAGVLQWLFTTRFVLYSVTYSIAFLRHVLLAGSMHQPLTWNTPHNETVTGLH